LYFRIRFLAPNSNYSLRARVSCLSTGQNFSASESPFGTPVNITTGKIPLPLRWSRLCACLPWGKSGVQIPGRPYFTQSCNRFATASTFAQIAVLPWRFVAEKGTTNSLHGLRRNTVKMKGLVLRFVSLFDRRSYLWLNWFHNYVKMFVCVKSANVTCMLHSVFVVMSYLQLCVKIWPPLDLHSMQSHVTRLYTLAIGLCSGLGVKYHFFLNSNIMDVKNEINMVFGYSLYCYPTL